MGKARMNFTQPANKMAAETDTLTYQVLMINVIIKQFITDMKYEGINKIKIN